MSALSDLFRGNVGNLGHDLFGSPTATAETLGGIAAVALPFLAPELLGAAFMPAAGEAAAGAAAGEAAAPSLGAMLGGAGAAGGALDATGLATAADAPSTALGFTGDLAPNAVVNQGFTALSDPVLGLPPAAPPATPSFVANPIGGDFSGVNLMNLTGGTGDVPDFGAWMQDPNLPASLTTPGPETPFGPTDQFSGTALAFNSPAPGGGGVAGGSETVANPATGGGVTVSGTGPAGTQPLSFGQKFAGNLEGLAANPMAWLGAAGLGANLASGYQQKQALNRLQGQENQLAQSAITNANQLRAEAQPEFGMGKQLTEYLTTGTLPKNVQASLDRMVAGQKAQIIQGYASRGQSTDPLQNSALQQELANVDQNAQVAAGNLQNTYATAGQNMINMANNLLASGLKATDIAAQIPIDMQKLNIALNAATAQAMSGFAAALGGGMRQPGQAAPSWFTSGGAAAAPIG